MKRLFLFAAFCCVLVTSIPVRAQFIVHNNGNAEIGVDNFDPETANLPPQF